MAVLEGILRDDVVWRPVALVLALGLAVPALVAAHAPPRRGRGGVRCRDRGSISPPSSAAPGRWGCTPTGFVLLLPYSLFRWGSGREAVIGLAIIVIARGLGIAADFTGVFEAVFGMRVLAVPRRARRLRPLSDCLPAPRDRPGQAPRARAAGARAARHRRPPRLGHRHPGPGRPGRRRIPIPTAAVEALEVIEEEASRTLAEMRTMVGALRAGRGARPRPAARRGRHRAARSQRR